MARFRERITVGLPLTTFILAYFFTTVLGNILYVLPIGRDFPKRSMPDFTWDRFHQPFDGWFWLLVLSPLVVTPLMGWFIAQAARPLAKKMASAIPEFSFEFFTLVNVICLIYIAVCLYRVDALAMLLAGNGPMEAVSFRFELLERLGLPPRFVLMSILPFLTTYIIIKAVRVRSLYWVTFAALNIILVSAFFVLLNMKWPIVLFEITIAAAVFVSVPKRYIITSGTIFAASVVTYFAVSVAILRIPTNPAVAVAESLPSPTHTSPAVMNPAAVKEPSAISTTTGTPVTIKEAAQPAAPVISDAALAPEPLAQRAPTLTSDEAPAPTKEQISSTPQRQPARPVADVAVDLLIVAVNRMAMAVPFFYDVETTEGPVCGSFFDKFVRRLPNACHPSNFIYAKMFPTDGFAGRGVAPAAHQIYEYAREGWAGATVALLLGSIVIGLYTACFYARHNDIFAAAFVTGIPAAYMLSQLPIESVTVLENGAAWWVLLVLANAGIEWTRKRLVAGHSLSAPGS